MTKAHRLKARKSILPLAKSIPVNFLLGCPENALADFVLARYAEAADLRKQMQAIWDCMLEKTALAMLGEWFRTVDRNDLRHALENPEDVVAWAQEQIRKQGYHHEEFAPLQSLPPGAAHLAAAIRYQERNLAEGKCAVCPTPLAHNSVRYCDKHLTMARLRNKPKNAKGAPPGSVGYLYGEGFESQHGRQPGTLQSLAISREKKTRAVLAQLGLPPESAATALQAARNALLEHMPRSEKTAMTVLELFDKAGLTDSLVSTAKITLKQLFDTGQVQRTGKGVAGSPYLYFAAGGDPERAKRELADGHAIENVGRHLRGAR